jgi:hypothetical protein
VSKGIHNLAPSYLSNFIFPCFQLHTSYSVRLVLTSISLNTAFCFIPLIVHILFPLFGITDSNSYHYLCRKQILFIFKKFSFNKFYPLY